MSLLSTVLANLIRQGKITIEVPNFDLDELRRAVQCEAAEQLKKVEYILCEEDMTAEEKLRWIGTHVQF